MREGRGGWALKKLRYPGKAMGLSNSLIAFSVYPILKISWVTRLLKELVDLCLFSSMVFVKSLIKIKAADLKKFAKS